MRGRHNILRLRREMVGRLTLHFIAVLFPLEKSGGIGDHLRLGLFLDPCFLVAFQPLHDGSKQHVVVFHIMFEPPGFGDCFVALARVGFPELTKAFSITFNFINTDGATFPSKTAATPRSVKSFIVRGP